MVTELEQLRNQWARAAVLGQPIIPVDEIDVGQRYHYSRNPDAVDPRPVTLEQIVKVLRDIALWLDRRGYGQLDRTVACPHFIMVSMMPGRNRYLNMRLDFCDSCLKILFPPPKDEDT